MTTATLPPDTVTPLAYSADALDAHGCRQLVSEILWRGLYEASLGNPSAKRWLATPYAAHLAGLLDIAEWPPSKQALLRVRTVSRRNARA